MSTTVRIGIVGSAGRKEDGVKWNRLLLENVQKCIMTLIEQTLKLQKSNVYLVSGGSAWADHAALYVWLDGWESWKGLDLHLPCTFDMQEKRYTPGTTEGSTLNELHKSFSNKTGRNTLNDLFCCISTGASVEVHNSFTARNIAIAQSVDYLIAFTFADGPTPKPGGTSITWKRCSSAKVHIPLERLRADGVDKVLETLEWKNWGRKRQPRESSKKTPPPQLEDPKTKVPQLKTYKTPPPVRKTVNAQAVLTSRILGSKRKYSGPVVSASSLIQRSMDEQSTKRRYSQHPG